MGYIYGCDQCCDGIRAVLCSDYSSDSSYSSSSSSSRSSQSSQSSSSSSSSSLTSQTSESTPRRSSGSSTSDTSMTSAGSWERDGSVSEWEGSADARVPDVWVRHRHLVKIWDQQDITGERMFDYGGRRWRIDPSWPQAQPPRGAVVLSSLGPLHDDCEASSQSQSSNDGYGACGECCSDILVSVSQPGEDAKFRGGFVATRTNSTACVWTGDNNVEGTDRKTVRVEYLSNANRWRITATINGCTGVYEAPAVEASDNPWGKPCVPEHGWTFAGGGTCAKGASVSARCPDGDPEGSWYWPAIACELKADGYNFIHVYHTTGVYRLDRKGPSYWDSSPVESSSLNEPYAVIHRGSSGGLPTTFWVLEIYTPGQSCEKWVYSQLDSAFTPSAACGYPSGLRPWAKVFDECEGVCGESSSDQPDFPDGLRVEPAGAQPECDLYIEYDGPRFSPGTVVHISDWPYCYSAIIEYEFFGGGPVYGTDLLPEGARSIRLAYEYDEEADRVTLEVSGTNCENCLRGLPERVEKPYRPAVPCIAGRGPTEYVQVEGGPTKSVTFDHVVVPDSDESGSEHTECYRYDVRANTTDLPPGRTPITPADQYKDCITCTGGRLAVVCPKSTNSSAAQKVWVIDDEDAMPASGLTAAFEFKNTTGTKPTYCYRISRDWDKTDPPEGAVIVTPGSLKFFDSCETCKCHTQSENLGVRASLCPGQPGAVDGNYWVKAKHRPRRPTYWPEPGTGNCYVINPFNALVEKPEDEGTWVDPTAEGFEQYESCIACILAGSSSSSQSSQSDGLSSPSSDSESSNAHSESTGGTSSESDGQTPTSQSSQDQTSETSMEMSEGDLSSGGVSDGNVSESSDGNTDGDKSSDTNYGQSRSDGDDDGQSNSSGGTSGSSEDFSGSGSSRSTDCDPMVCLAWCSCVIPDPDFAGNFTTLEWCCLDDCGKRYEEPFACSTGSGTGMGGL